ncbi:MAG: hypothetical protein Q8P66_01335 [Candidatus Colwellbacteria bacterium]|nr:hypothetical protein [Candidatus Colwellbacteria bacterium]
MTTILITIALVALFASVFLLVKKAWLSSICPICLGVSLTWLALTVLMLLGYASNDYFLPTALLMGGTVVGIVYQGEKKFKVMRSFTPKMAVLIIGLILAYLLLTNVNWLTLIEAALILTPLGYLFFLRSPQATAEEENSETVKDLEDKMKECC